MGPVALVLGFAALAIAQAPPPPLPPPPIAEQPVAPTFPAPGVLPADAAPEAILAWKKVLDASLPSGSERQPVTSFELTLDVRYRGSQQQSNDFSGVYRFLAPGFVSIGTVDRDDPKRIKREHLRGPTGDWLVDHTRPEPAQFLGVDRAYAEDRRQLDEAASIARTFVALTDPRGLRILTLHKLALPPAGLPASVGKRAAELSWLRVRTPDFGLVGGDAKSKVFQVALGADAKSGAVELALVDEDGEAASVRATSRLVQFLKLRPIDGYRVPQQILVWTPPAGPPAGPTAPAFSDKADTDLWVVAAKLRAQLSPESFKP